MKTFHAVALSLLTGAGLGGATVQVLQAQAKAPVYYVAEVEITDAAGYQKEFVPRAQALMGRAGGQFLVQGGKTSFFERRATETACCDFEMGERRPTHGLV